MTVDLHECPCANCEEREDWSHMNEVAIGYVCPDCYRLKEVHEVTE